MPIPPQILSGILKLFEAVIIIWRFLKMTGCADYKVQNIVIVSIYCHCILKLNHLFNGEKKSQTLTKLIQASKA